MKMTFDDWKDIKHSKPANWDSPDHPGSWANVEKELVYLYDLICSESGVVGRITSGYRSNMHNKEVKGVKNSEHTTGQGVDFIVATSQDYWKVVQVLVKLGIKRVGSWPKKKMFHVGISKTLPQKVWWGY